MFYITEPWKLLVNNGNLNIKILCILNEVVLNHLLFEHYY